MDQVSVGWMDEATFRFHRVEGCTAQLIPHHSKVILAKSCRRHILVLNISPDLNEFHDDGDDSSNSYF